MCDSGERRSTRVIATIYSFVCARAFSVHVISRNVLFGLFLVCSPLISASFFHFQQIHTQRERIAMCLRCTAVSTYGRKIACNELETSHDHKWWKWAPRNWISFTLKMALTIALSCAYTLWLSLSFFSLSVCFSYNIMCLVLCINYE